MAIKQFLYVDTDGFYTEGHVEGSTIVRDCDSSLTVGDLVCESSSITNGVDAVTSNQDKRSVIGYCIAKPTATTAEIMTKGVIDGLSGLSKGSKVYLGTDGKFSTAIPSQGYIHILGHAVETNKLDFNPTNTKIKTSYKAIAPAAYTVLLIHSDNTDGDTNIVDASGTVTISRDNNPIHSTDTSVFGASSIKFGTDDGLYWDASGYGDFDGDFTVDFWFNYATNDYGHLFGSDSNTPFILKMSGSDPGTPYVYGDGLSSTYFSESLDLNTWYHVALERYNGTIYGYVNGVRALAVDYPDTFTYNMMIINTYGSSTDKFSGYVDEYRLLKGYADYKGNDFTPPSAPYTIE